jgi:hypothetical protein
MVRLMGSTGMPKGKSKEHMGQPEYRPAIMILDRSSWTHVPVKPTTLEKHDQSDDLLKPVCGSSRLPALPYLSTRGNMCHEYGVQSSHLPSQKYRALSPVWSASQQVLRSASKITR